MPEPITIAVAAGALLIPYLKDAGSAAAKKFGEAAAGQIGELLARVRKRFADQGDPGGSAALDQLAAGAPAEVWQKPLESQIAAHAEKDPAFGASLEELISAITAASAEAARVVNTATAVVQTNKGIIFNAPGATFNQGGATFTGTKKDSAP